MVVTTANLPIRSTGKHSVRETPEYGSVKPISLAGIALNLELTNSQSVQMKREDYTWGLPTIAGSAIAPRPADLMPAPGHPDYTIVRKQLSIPIDV
jgi:hypothetical protein